MSISVILMIYALITPFVSSFLGGSHSICIVVGLVIDTNSSSGAADGAA